MGASAAADPGAELRVAGSAEGEFESAAVPPGDGGVGVGEPGGEEVGVVCSFAEVDFDGVGCDGDAAEAWMKSR